MDARLEPWESCLEDFAAAPGIGVGIVTIDGEIVYHNAEAVRLHFGDPSLELSGKRLVDLYPLPWVEARMNAYRRAAETGRTILVRSLSNGIAVETTVRPIASEAGESPRVLLILRAGRTPESALPSDVEVIDLEAVSLGALAVLTPRELEVLALIGHGHSAKEIAEILHCSPRTVERHRDSIGKKLQKRDRVELALIAHEAGLELRDAQRPRVQPHVGPEARAQSEVEMKPPAVEEAGSPARDGD